MDIRQSPQYCQFMKLLDWRVEKAGKWQVFIKKFPIVGSLIKIQRVTPPVPFEEIEKLAKRHRAFKVVIEFDKLLKSPRLPNTYKVYKSPFLPTKTIIINLKRTEAEIFNSFSPEKRRAVRKAEKNGVVVKKGTAEEFIFLKKRSLLEKLILPFGSKREIKALWKVFAPSQAKILIAYLPPNSPNTHNIPNFTPLAGILLLFHQKTAYYWQAAATNKGKKLFAPSHLVWEALKIAKKLGCTEFDFEGIYDERFPISSWKGFTKFKGEFGGREITYPNPLLKK